LFGVRKTFCCTGCARQAKLSRITTVSEGLRHSMGICKQPSLHLVARVNHDTAIAGPLAHFKYGVAILMRPQCKLGLKCSAARVSMNEKEMSSVSCAAGRFRNLIH
jgi:hypothetical protein